MKLIHFLSHDRARELVVLCDESKQASILKDYVDYQVTYVGTVLSEAGTETLLPKDRPLLPE